MMPQEFTKIELPLGVGRLGALAPAGADSTTLLIAALDMAERRILRLEMLLRRAGIEPESIGVPE